MGSGLVGVCVLDYIAILFFSLAFHCVVLPHLYSSRPLDCLWKYYYTVSLLVGSSAHSGHNIIACLCLSHLSDSSLFPTRLRLAEFRSVYYPLSPLDNATAVYSLFTIEIGHSINGVNGLVPSQTQLLSVMVRWWVWMVV